MRSTQIPLFHGNAKIDSVRPHWSNDVSGYLCESLVWHLSHTDHLLPQMVLVFTNAAVPSFYRLVLTNHDVLRDFVK